MKLFLFILINLINIHIYHYQNNDQLYVKITPLFDNNPIQLSKANKDSISIETLKFYLTDFCLIKSGEVVWKQLNSYHLIDISKPTSLDIFFTNEVKVDFDEIQFLLGTDSLTNVSGAIGGDLDPTKGMYWAWNSGYINFKLEGKQNSKPFQFHLGGYASPYPTVQKIKLKTKKNLNIAFNVADFLNQLNLVNQNKIMSPGKEAQELSEILSSLFYINEKE